MKPKNGQSKVLNLKELRTLLGLSQEELALAAGVTTGYIAHIENYKRALTPESANKIAQALSNMLNTAKDDGDLIKVSDEKVKILSKKFKLSRGNMDYDDGEDTDNIKNKETIPNIEIIPEILVASNTAGFYPVSTRRRAYNLLVDIEMKKRELECLKTHGDNCPQNILDDYKRKYKLSPAEIIQAFLADSEYRMAWEGVKDDFRERLSRMKSGYYLNQEDEV